MIDSHQHFWEYDPVRDTWIDQSMTVLKRDFLPEHLDPLLADSAIEGSVAVQADQSEEETLFLIRMAQENPWVLGVVGWIDLCAYNREERLSFYRQFGVVKGFRHIVQAEPPGFMLRQEFIKGVKALSPFGYTYDLLLYESQLEEAAKFVEAVPGQPIVVDHMAKPQIGKDPTDRWVKGIRKLASNSHVYCKLSGLVTETGNLVPDRVNFEPFFDVVLEAFGPERILFGSDWPVCTLKASYKEVFELAMNLISSLSASEQVAILGANARSFYNLDKN